MKKMNKGINFKTSGCLFILSACFILILFSACSSNIGRTDNEAAQPATNDLKHFDYNLTNESNIEPAQTTRDKKFCQALTSPVCGIDGKTYFNTCDSNYNKIQIAYVGDCEQKTQLITGTQCQNIKAFVCAINGVTYQNGCLAKLKSMAVAGKGTCAEYLSSGNKLCDLEPKITVCGSDKRSYANECTAKLYKVNVTYEGACK